MPTLEISDLVRDFPDIPFAHQASAFLEKAGGMLVFNQLRYCSISLVTISHPSKKGQGATIDEGDAMPSRLELTDQSTLNVYLVGDFSHEGDLLRAFGYQLAKSLGYNLTSAGLQATLVQDLDRLHHFCEAFAEIWIQRVDMAEAIRVLRSF